MTTEANWDENMLNEMRLLWLQEYNDTRYTKSGVIAIDNVLIDHSGKTIEDVGYFWDHADKRNIIAHDYLIANYVCPSEKHYPLEFRRFKKKNQCDESTTEFKTHTTLFCELVNWTEKHKIPGFFAFDSYFTNSIIQNHINSFKDKKGNARPYIGDLKFNRKVYTTEGLISISDYTVNIKSDDRLPIITNRGQQWYWSKTFSMPDVDHRMRIVILWDRKNGTEIKKILVSNRTEWSAEKITNVYSKRWTGNRNISQGRQTRIGDG